MQQPAAMSEAADAMHIVGTPSHDDIITMKPRTRRIKVLRLRILGLDPREKACPEGHVGSGGLHKAQVLTTMHVVSKY